MSNFKKILTSIIAAVLVFGMLPIGTFAVSGATQTRNASATEYEEWKLPMNWATDVDKDGNGWELASKNNGLWRLTSFTDLSDITTMRWKASTAQLVDKNSHSKSPESYLESFANRDILSGASAGWASWYVNFGTRHQKKNFGFGDNSGYMYAYPGNGDYNNSTVVFTAPKDATYDFTELVTLNKADAAVTATVRKNGAEIATAVPTASGNTIAGSVELKTGDLLMFSFALTNSATIDDNNPAVKISDLVISIGEKPDDYGKPEAPDWSDIETPVYPDGEAPLLVIGAISDPHTDYGLQGNDPYIRPAYITALKTLKKEGADLILVGGDITSDNEDGGKRDLRWDKDVYDRTIAQYGEYTSQASKTGLSLWACGNHDHEVGILKDGKITEGDYDSFGGFQDLMLAGAGKPISLYTEKDERPNTPDIYKNRWLGAHYNLQGFDFIIINAPYNAWQEYSAGTLNWLDKTLAGIGADKTVFIVGHYPLADNRGVTNPSSYGIKGDAYDAFVKVMNKYDNAIYFYGHNHGKANNMNPYISADVFERITHYDASGNVVNDRNVKPSSFVTAFMGSAGYYGSSLTAADPDVIQAMTIKVFGDRIEFEMINCGKQTGASMYPAIWTIKRNIVAPKHEDAPAPNASGLWEIGSVSSANGMNADAANRVRIGNYLSLNDFTEVSAKAGYQLMYFAYDHANNYLGNNSNAWTADGGKITMASIKEKYPSAVNFKVVMRKTNDGNMSISDVITSGVKTVVNANAPETEGIYNGSLYGINVEYANGAILANGKVDRNASGQYCKTYLPISEFSKIAGDGDALVKYFAYDANLKLIASGATDLSAYSIQYIKNSYPGVAYFRFNITTSGSDALLQGNLSATHTFKEKLVATVNSQQDGALYDGKLFMFDKEGTCYVSDYKTGASIATFKLGSLDKIKPYCNAVSFSDVFYAKGDKYPLLYANVYNTYESQTDRKEGHLCVYRIKENGTTFTAQLVQIIKIGFVNDLDLWKSKKDNGDVRSYGNFVIDTDNNELIAFVARDASMSTRFFRFKLPKPTAGTSTSAFGCKVVTLTKKNIVKQFDTDYIPYIQGCTYYNGNVISVSGMAGEGKIHIIDIKRGAISTEIDCASIGLTAEPQMVDVDRATGKIVYTAIDNVVRAFDFGKYTAPTAKEVYASAAKPSTSTTDTPTTTPSDTTVPNDTTSSNDDDDDEDTRPSETTPPETTEPDTGAKKDGDGNEIQTLIIAIVLGVGCVAAAVVIWIVFGPKKTKKQK